MSIAPTARPDSHEHHELPPHPWDIRTICVLLTVHLAALTAPFFFSWSGLFVGLILYAITAMGITIGYHRLLTHQSYRAPQWLSYFFVTCAALSAQAGPAMWVAIHRQHHANSDHEHDPHDASKGFWWSHLGWMIKITPRRLDEDFAKRLARDVLEDPYYRFLDKHFFGLSAISVIILYLIGGWSWLIWAGFVRIAAVFHATWLVNSAAHRFGYRTYATSDRSTNCWWVALLTFGEGWHNNHHAFPRSARHGLKWYEVDLSWMLLSFLSRVGLVEKLQTPSEKQFERFSDSENR
jgi:stearoyl-CoA desaturase (delta-9 desaturase)